LQCDIRLHRLDDLAGSCGGLNLVVALMPREGGGRRCQQDDQESEYE